MRKCTLLLLLLFTILSLHSQNEDQSYELDSFVFISKRTIGADRIQLSNRDFKKQAASFDDPSRLLMHYPGFSATGDQANAISYHGLPSALFSWQLNGVDIVNPNHLANAGTASDLGSSSAGGVNMMSGNVIDRFNFHTSHSNDKINGTLGGVADITLGAPVRSFVQLSLLGLETGLKKKLGNTTLYGNYRYSFTGLMGDLGVKFGDEDIRFQDLVLGLNHQGKKSTLKFDFATGSSKNIHLPVNNDDRPLAEQSIKDTLDIRYKSNITIVSSQYQYRVSDNNSWKIAAAYSQRDDSRTMTGPVNLVNQIAYTANDLYSNNDARLSGQVYFKMDLLNIGLRYTNYNNDYFNKTKFVDLANVSNYSELIPYIKVDNSLFKKFTISTYLGVILRKKPKLLSNYRLAYTTGDLTIAAGGSTTQQNLGSYYVNQPDQPYITSDNFLFEVKYAKSKLNTSVQLFNHNISKGPSFTGNGNVYQYFTGLEGIDFNKNMMFVAGEKKYNIYGLTAQIEYHLPQFWINTNATLYDQDFVSESNHNYAINFNIGKDFQLKKNKLSLSSSVHYRGPQSFFSIDLTKHYVDKNYGSPSSELTNSYSRIDFRAVYNLKNSLWSLDIQNLNSQLNHTFITPTNDNRLVLNGGLGLIPVLTWKRMF
jgi:hypothetical protein